MNCVLTYKNNQTQKPTPYHHHKPLFQKRQRTFTGKGFYAEAAYYYKARYLDPRTSRWLGVDPAMGEYVPSAPINEEAKKRNGNLPGMGGVFNYVNFHVYHYAGNNPVKYTDPDGRESGLLTDSDAVLGAGHSAMYVEVYNKNGTTKGYELYEVGPTKFNGTDITGGKDVLSSNKLDSSSPYPINLTNIGLAWSVLSSAANSAGLEAGVTVEFFKNDEHGLAQFENRISKYDNKIIFNTTPKQDLAIRSTANATGKSFGKYNLFSNNCIQYASNALSKGGINTSNFFVPNIAHDFSRRNNGGKIISK